MIDWPAIIKFYGHDELTYVDSESTWLSNAGLSAIDYEKSDILIDNNGCIYHLNNIENGVVHPGAAEDTMTLSQFIKLVQLHASLNGECCIEKIGCRSFAEGIKIVASISDENK